jgi:hypothetical protein
MRRLIIPVALIALLVVGLSAGPAYAASATSLLFPNQVNQLEDDDWEAIGSASGPTFVENDFLVGMFTITNVVDATGGGGGHLASVNGATFTGVFALEYSGSSVTLGTETYYSFRPVDVAWSTLAIGGVNLGLPDVSTGTVALIFDNNTVVSTDWGFVDPNAADIPTALGTAMIAGNELWEIGFTGANGTASADEFWYSSTISSVPVPSLSWEASLNVVKPYAGAPTLLPHDYRYDGSLLGLSAMSAVQLRGNFESIGAESGVFDLKTDADFWIKPTPEPGSLALLGLGLCAIGGAVYRRRRRA